MSEMENTLYPEEEFVELEEGFIDDDTSIENEISIEFPETVEPKVSKKRKKFSAELKVRRGKFSLRWEKDFPWVRANNINESLGVCTICDKELVCKRSHLERHEKSNKHQLFLAGLKNKPGNNSEYVDTNWNQEEINEMAHIEIDPGYCEDVDIKPIDCTMLTSPVAQEMLPQSSPLNKSKKNLEKLLNRIDRNRSELSVFHKKLQGETQQAPQTVVVAPPKDSFDLFFESVSASVKTLPPKLAAEVKSKVSQLIAEFELRAIVEREFAMANAEAVLSYESLPKMHHVTSTTTFDGNSAQIVYTLPLKQSTTQQEQNDMSSVLMQ